MNSSTLLAFWSNLVDIFLSIETNTIIALVSAVAALLSALYAANSARSARRSADVAERQYADTAAGIEAYLIDAYSWVDKDGRQIVAIGCTLTNVASTQTSVVQTELRVHEYSSGETLNPLILRPIIANLPTGDVLERLPHPLNLPGRGSISGWFTFHLPGTFTEQRTVDKYELQLTTATGRRTGISTHIMRKVIYGSK